MNTTFNVIVGICLLGALPAVFASGNCDNEYPSIPFSTPSSNFTIQNNGTVIHHPTGLMWMRCSLGQTWDGANCTGSASIYNWQNALAQHETHFVGYADWRLPNKNELATIVEERCWSPTVNSAIFSNVPSARFWSSSPSEDNGDYAWFVDFSDGNVRFGYKGNDGHVRLVRAGQ